MSRSRNRCLNVVCSPGPARQRQRPLGICRPLFPGSHPAHKPRRLHLDSPHNSCTIVVWHKPGANSGLLPPSISMHRRGLLPRICAQTFGPVPKLPNTMVGPVFSFRFLFFSLPPHRTYRVRSVIHFPFRYLFWLPTVAIYQQPQAHMNHYPSSLLVMACNSAEDYATASVARPGKPTTPPSL